MLDYCSFPFDTTPSRNNYINKPCFVNNKSHRDQRHGFCVGNVSNHPNTCNVPGHANDPFKEPSMISDPLQTVGASNHNQNNRPTASDIFGQTADNTCQYSGDGLQSTKYCSTEGCRNNNLSRNINYMGPQYCQNCQEPKFLSSIRNLSELASYVASRINKVAANDDDSSKVIKFGFRTSGDLENALSSNPLSELNLTLFGTYIRSIPLIKLHIF